MGFVSGREVVCDRIVRQVPLTEEVGHVGTWPELNKSEAVKKARKEANDEKLSAKEKKKLSEQEKEYKSLRKQIQEKLIEFATRVPVFMYLTDYGERTLKDVITQLESGLLKKVTGLVVKDFELLVSLGVFNNALMNDAVYKFKRCEDASLSYTGINKHEGEDIGLYEPCCRGMTIRLLSLMSLKARTPLGNEQRDRFVERPFTGTPIKLSNTDQVASAIT